MISRLYLNLGSCTVIENCISYKDNGTGCIQCKVSFYLKELVEGDAYKLCSKCDNQLEEYIKMGSNPDGFGKCGSKIECQRKFPSCSKCSENPEQCEECDVEFYRIKGENGLFTKCEVCSEQGNFIANSGKGNLIIEFALKKYMYLYIYMISKRIINNTFLHLIFKIALLVARKIV